MSLSPAGYWSKWYTQNRNGSGVLNGNDKGSMRVTTLEEDDILRVDKIAAVVTGLTADVTIGRKNKNIPGSRMVDTIHTTE
jgi:hypothetical protein